LIERERPKVNVHSLKKLRADFSADAFIQAAKDRLELSDKRFTNALVKELYAPAKAKLTSAEWTALMSALNARHVGRNTPATWRAFLSLIDLHYPSLTARGIANTIVELLDTDLSPSIILSFNAEPLLAALINATVADKRGGSPNTDVIDYVTASTTNRKRDRIPFAFCHGLLPVPATAGGRPLSSIDKLVFSEASYLQLANNAYSWQSQSFIRAASFHSLVFVGVSLTDSNMRRWLSWVHATRLQELSLAGVKSPTSTVHYWIAKAPGSMIERRWAESLVAHLGVRLVWVADYADMSPTLRAMIGHP